VPKGNIGRWCKMVIEIGPILQDFTVIMIVASVMAMISYKLKQPMVIGYIMRE
jgi:CPA2 family monovalent cation:H+ antiporter-2